MIDRFNNDDVLFVLFDWLLSLICAERLLKSHLKKINKKEFKWKWNFSKKLLTDDGETNIQSCLLYARTMKKLSNKKNLTQKTKHNTYMREERRRKTYLKLKMQGKMFISMCKTMLIHDLFVRHSTRTLKNARIHSKEKMLKTIELSSMRWWKLYNRLYE